MKNPVAEAYIKMLQEAKKEKEMDPVGKADADIDNDGDVDDSDEYLHKRRKAIKKSMKEEMCPKCKCDPCECEDEDDVDEACSSKKGKKEALEIDPDDGETKKSSDDDKKKKKKDAESEVQDVEEGVELAEGKKLRNVLTDREFEKSMKKALADKGNYKGGKVNWNFIDADVYMELSAKGYDLRHPSINYMKRFDALADKLDPEMNESVELEESKVDKKIESAMNKLIIKMKKEKKKTSEILKALKVNFPSYDTDKFYANFKNEMAEAHVGDKQPTDIKDYPVKQPKAGKLKDVLSKTKDKTENKIEEARADYKNQISGTHRVKATVCYIDPMTRQRKCEDIFFKSKMDALGFKDNVKGFPKGAEVEAISGGSKKMKELRK